MNLIAYSFRERGRVRTIIADLTHKGSDRLLDWPTVVLHDSQALAINPKLTVTRPAAPWERIAFAWRASNA